MPNVKSAASDDDNGSTRLLTVVRLMSREFPWTRNRELLTISA